MIFRVQYRSNCAYTKCLVFNLQVKCRGRGYLRAFLFVVAVSPFCLTVRASSFLFFFSTSELVSRSRFRSFFSFSSLSFFALACSFFCNLSRTGLFSFSFSLFESLFLLKSRSESPGSADFLEESREAGGPISVRSRLSLPRSRLLVLLSLSLLLLPRSRSLLLLPRSLLSLFRSSFFFSFVSSFAFSSSFSSFSFLLRFTMWKSCSLIIRPLQRCNFPR